jgi:hypothetical protein
LLATVVPVPGESPSNLEPIADEVHPPHARRLPTPPPIDLELERPGPKPAVAEPRVQVSAPPMFSKFSSRSSPAPVRRGLFSIDRPTNLLAGAAIGLLLAIYPAKQLAERYEARQIAPRIAVLADAIDQPLAVDAGLVASPEALAEELHAARAKVRWRFLLVWSIAGLGIGAVLGSISRD